MFSDIMHGIMITMSPDCLLALCIGAMFGTVVGALPGLGTAVAITICIPFTLQMGNASAIALLLGVYATSIYGGSISAVLLNTPGTPQSACTGFEGYAMAKAGKAEKALGWITMSSVLGGLFSCVALVIAAPQLADLSVKYGGPLEICGLICLGLACITSLSEDNQIKGLLMGVAGLFLATIGVDPLSGEMRFTFGSPQLVSGIDLMPIVVGVFPLAELFYRAYEVHANVEPTAIDCKRISFPTWQEWKGRGLILLRSSLIGVGLGILPGTGATAATFVSYSSAKRLSKNGENFGKGEPDGLVAAESSNNAVAGGAMVPTLALGIPGEPVMALMLATLTLHGITPGVRLMADNPDIVYSTFLSLILANLLIIPTAIITVRGFGKLIKFPTAILLSIIVICSLLGVYLPRSNMFDVWMALLIGVIAFLMRFADFPVAPFLIGYVLSAQLEYRLGQAVIYKGDMPLTEYLFSAPVALVLFAVSACLLLALAAVCLMTGSAVAADAFPNRPITIVVPFAAGGETDLVARMLADGMSKELKQVMVVQNIVGASGVAGISAVTGAKPDGYTLGVTPSAPLAMHPHMRKVPYTLDSFDFVGRILKAPYIVMVAKTAPWNTLDDMLRDMKANPNTFFFASSGVGSVPYFAMMDLFKKAGAQVRHVPFSGDADAFQAIAGNRVQVYTSTAGSLDQYDVKGLALMDATRDPLLPNLPTVKESGVEAYYSQWMPLLAPKGLPADVKATLSDAMRKAMQSPEFVERLHKLNLVPGYLDSKDCRAFVEEESVRNAEVIKGLMAK